jgi:hypothetical protein
MPDPYHGPAGPCGSAAAAPSVGVDRVDARQMVPVAPVGLLSDPQQLPGGEPRGRSSRVRRPRARP